MLETGIGNIHHVGADNIYLGEVGAGGASAAFDLEAGLIVGIVGQQQIDLTAGDCACRQIAGSARQVGIDLDRRRGRIAGAPVVGDSQTREVTSWRAEAVICRRAEAVAPSPKFQA